MIFKVFVWVFCKAIQVNKEKNDVNTINLFCVTLCNAISKWGEKIMRAHLVCKFKELEATFYKCYKKSTYGWTSVHDITNVSHTDIAMAGSLNFKSCVRDIQVWEVIMGF